MTKDEFLADASAKLHALHKPEPSHQAEYDAIVNHEVGRLGASLDHLGMAPNHLFVFRFPDGTMVRLPFGVTITARPPEPLDPDGKVRVLAPIRSYDWKNWSVDEGTASPAWKPEDETKWTINPEPEPPHV